MAFGPYRPDPVYEDPEERRFYGNDYSEFYRPWIDPIVDLGWQLGYVIAAHGSLKRDLDMIAAPWIEDCTSDEVLARAICTLIDGRIMTTKPYAGKPHNRRVWSIHFHGKDHRHIHKYIDLSVFPKQSKD